MWNHLEMIFLTPKSVWNNFKALHIFWILCLQRWAELWLSKLKTIAIYWNLIVTLEWLPSVAVWLYLLPWRGCRLEGVCAAQWGHDIPILSHFIKAIPLTVRPLSAAYMDYCLCLTCFLSLVLSPFERVLDSWTLLSFMMELLKNSVAMQEQVLACKGFLVIGYTLERVRRTQTNTAGWHVHNRSLLSDQQVH